MIFLIILISFRRFGQFLSNFSKKYDFKGIKVGLFFLVRYQISFLSDLNSQYLKPDKYRFCPTETKTNFLTLITHYIK